MKTEKNPLFVSSCVVHIMCFCSTEDLSRYTFVFRTNCAKQAAKVLRKFYKRPYFLPASVETFEQNFLFFSKQYKGKEASEVNNQYSQTSP